jgi:hypothetical protein
MYRTISIVNSNQQVNVEGLGINVSQKILDDAVTKGKTSTITNKLEKQTYKANQFEVAKGGNASDILKNLPSVSVNSAGEISVRGATRKRRSIV